MSFDKQNNSCLTDKGQECGCADHQRNGHDSCEKHNHDGCGCNHEHDSVTLILDDDSELKCLIIDIFEIHTQSYIALLHPINETVLLFRFSAHEDDTIDVDEIEDDEEFELVSKTFMSMQ